VERWLNFTDGFSVSCRAQHRMFEAVRPNSLDMNRKNQTRPTRHRRIPRQTHPPHPDCRSAQSRYDVALDVVWEEQSESYCEVL